MILPNFQLNCRLPKQVYQENYGDNDGDGAGLGDGDDGEASSHAKEER